MNQQFRHRSFPAGNPLANALVVIAGIVVISLSLALGFFVFLGIAAFVLVMAAVMSVRTWWYRRKFAGGQAQEFRRETTVRKQIIEGEYQEVRRRQEDRDRP